MASTWAIRDRVYRILDELNRFDPSAARQVRANESRGAQAKGRSLCPRPSHTVN